uniref:DUF4794 domain-containing protein n=1 Tax=Glossina palpalis gambiensis TaxID=67801 RepID=A0A1B0B046_9MUSC
MKSHFIGYYLIPLVLADIYLAESLTYLPPKGDVSNTSREQQVYRAPIYGNQSYETFEFVSPYETNQELHVERAPDHFHLRDATRPHYENRHQPATYEISASSLKNSKENDSPEITFPNGNNYHLTHPLKTEQENHFPPYYFPYELKNNFKGSEHLPPAYTSKQSQPTYPEQKSSFKNSEYFSSLPATREDRVQFDYAAKTLLNTFKASEYFPPLHSSAEPTQQKQISTFKGVDYLPPHRSAYPQILLTTTRNFLPVDHQEIEQENGYFKDLIPQSYRGPDYLPPVQDEIHSIEPATGSFKGSEYLPPTTDHFSRAENQYKLSGYNGFPDYSRYNPEYKVPQMEQQSEGIFLKNEKLSADYNGFSKDILKASDHLSPAKSAEEVTTYKKPILPSQQSMQNVNTQPQFELTDKNEFPDIAYKITEENNESYDTNKIINDLQILPAGYDFDKPEHPEEALALLHSEDPRLHKSKTAAQQNSDRSIPIYNRPPHYRQKHLLDNSYIPSQLQYETSPHPVITVSSPEKSFDYAIPPIYGQTLEKNYIKILQGTSAKDFPTYQLNTGAEHLSSLANTSKVTDLKGTHPSPYYNPLKNSVISSQGAVKGESTINSITSKRTSATPSPSEGLHTSTNRPFLVYGTSVKTKQFKHFNIPSEYYIPSARNSQDYKTFPQASKQEATTLRYKTSQVLSAFMPKNTQKDGTENSYKDAVTKSATLPVAKSVKFKVRTVQIMNSDGVKSLKILETLDANGVKTIKILGTSEQEEPMGQHQLIRIINGSDQRTVQTVKIYNDQ